MNTITKLNALVKKKKMTIHEKAQLDCLNRMITNSESLSKLAYESFVQLGRGFIRIQHDTNSKDEKILRHLINYELFGKVEYFNWDKNMSSLKDLVASYDGLKEYVVILDVCSDKKREHMKPWIQEYEGKYSVKVAK